MDFHALTTDFLDAVALAASRCPEPLVTPWPTPGNPAAIVSFANFGEWRDFVLNLSLNGAIPKIVGAKFERALKLHILAWIDFDLIKAGELVALTTLEPALRDRYGPQTKKQYGNMNFGHLLRYMPEHDGLTDAKVPMIQRCGGSVVDLLTGKRDPSFADIRNDSAHGYSFDGFPWAGLLELVRDLIEYAYRAYRDEGRHILSANARSSGPITSP
jgi:hypothetical protein